jgi:CBS domain-containing protein
MLHDSIYYNEIKDLAHITLMAIWLYFRHGIFYKRRNGSKPLATAQYMVNNMNTEHTESYEVSQFLALHPLLGETAPGIQEQLLHKLHIAYIRAGKDLSFAPDNIPAMLILRSGCLEIKDAQENTLKDRLGAGDIIIPPYLYDSASNEATYHIHAAEDTLYYLIDKDGFSQICAQEGLLQNLCNAWHRRYVTGQGEETPPAEPDAQTLVPNWRHMQTTPLGTAQVADYMQTNIISAAPDISITQGAQIMAEHNVSSLLIITQENDVTRAVGIVSDKDLRNRVLAAQLSADQAISTIMSPSPIGVKSTDTLHTAQLAMMSHEIHHLVIYDNEQPIGIITSNDILKTNNLEPLPLLSRIKHASTRDELERATVFLPELVASLIDRNMRPSEIGQIITAFADALTRRLIKFAIRELGEPPFNYCWVAFGSQARQEQRISSDQDNALILERDPTDEDEQNYFTALARYVNDGLNACGFVYCPGDIMASNPKWRISLQSWLSQFDNWIDQPEPMALMHASIFFDLRAIGGDESLMTRLQEHVLKKAQANTIFLAYMTGNAIQHRPPLGFFKNFVVDNNGENINELDLKKRGTIPIVDIARNYALANGLTAVNTLERLRAIREHKILSTDLANSLIDAHEFIAKLTLRAQAKEQRNFEKVDNFLNPKDLSSLQRQQLKEAFQSVKDAQQIMENRFHTGA